ncbi:MAG: tetraacyldisaccharide 4'-kinase [Gammaproteobacteria bacterium]|nr:tetraacyldisaccharide 4'-kinase [Gammaproteobacteria bacterium]
MINFSRKLEKVWYSNKKPSYLLIILSKFFSLIVNIRSSLYKSGLLKIRKVKVPVIVIGNLTAGGTGKTPLTVLLSEFFHENDYKKKVGIISRGYKGRRSSKDPYILSENDNAIDFGDEAVYLSRRLSNAMVCVCKDKYRAAQMLVKSGAEIIISDDGLQHYKLGRDYEIAVVDGSRLLGNQYLLPAGPLRENIIRLDDVDLVLLNGGYEACSNWENHLHRAGMWNVTAVFNFTINNKVLFNLNDNSKHNLSEFTGKTVQVLAGIGNPERLYKDIEKQGIIVAPIEIEDHGVVDINIYSDDVTPLFMTPKDAVKYNKPFPKNAFVLDPFIEIGENNGDEYAFFTLFDDL